jgi:uncharacterized protein (UPF0332 family)
LKETTCKLLDKAVDTIESAELLLDHAKTDAAAVSGTRAYYALFHITEALLNEKGLPFSKHGDVGGCVWKRIFQNKTA